MGEGEISTKDTYAPAASEKSAPPLTPEEFVNMFANAMRSIAPEVAGIAALLIIMNLFLGRRKERDALDELIDRIADRVSEKLKRGAERGV